MGEGVGRGGRRRNERGGKSEVGGKWDEGKMGEWSECGMGIGREGTKGEE